MRAWQKALHREEWQPWFAWYPVEAGDSLVWLRWIERRRCYALIGWWWERRLPDSQESTRQTEAHRTGSERGETAAV